MSGTETARPEEANESLPVGDDPGPGRPPRDGPSRHRRTAVRTHRLRTAVVAVVVVAIVVAVPFLVLKASHTIANSKAGRTVTSLGATTRRLPTTPVALLVLKGTDGTVAGMALLALDGSGTGGNVLVVPAGTEVPGADGQPGTRLGDAYASGGLDAERGAGGGVFGGTTSLSGGGEASALAALLAPYAPIHVTLDARALDTGANGQPEVLHPAGAVDLGADQAAQLLLAHGVNESEAARLNRTAAVWTAVLAAGAQPTATTVP